MDASNYLITTERIGFKTITSENSEAIFQITSTYPEISEYMTWNPPQNLKEVEEKFLKNQNSEDRRFGIFDRETDQFFGQITIRNFHLMQQDAEKNSVFLSFWISPAFQGKGFASEALQALCAYCFEDLRIHKIFAGTFAQNTASQKLLKKAHFREIGTLRKHYLKNGTYFDSIRYELLDEDFAPFCSRP